MFRASVLVLSGLLLAGCVNMSSPTKLATGASAEAISAQLGEPTGRYAMPDGTTRLEYARGPYGRETWMLDVDGQGALLKATQVLDERVFNTVKAGITRDQLLRILGRPSRVGFVGWQNQTVWNYRYSSPFCQWFQVGLSQAGIVEDTGYGPDPLCDDVDTPLLGGFLRHR
jgi:hypothetical protein